MFHWFDLIFFLGAGGRGCFFGGKPEERKFVGLLIRKYKSLVWDDSKSFQIHTYFGGCTVFILVCCFFLLGGRPVLPQVLSQNFVVFSISNFLQSLWPNTSKHAGAVASQHLRNLGSRQELANLPPTKCPT